MVLTDIINIVGLTAYCLLTVFFLWVALIPNNKTRSYYWLFAVIFMLIGRIDLYFFPLFLDKANVQFIYALCLSIEKLFLMLGVLFFVHNTIQITWIKRLLTFSAITVVVLLLLYFSIGVTPWFLAWFSTNQALYLVLAAVIFWKNQRRWYLPGCDYLSVILIIYALHWLTFPIAQHFPIWLSLGYLFGNILNLFIYLYLAYLVVYRFQYRLIKAEKSARALAEKAKQASQAKSAFLANMSHEIRTPMNGTLSMLELLNKDELTKEQHERVTIALNSGKNLLVIINDILDFSKVEAGKLELNCINFNIKQLLTESINLLQRSADEKKLLLSLDMSAVTVEHIHADPVRIKQIIINLTNNAIKFTEQGEVQIIVSSKEVNNQVNFSCQVIDTGIGIEKDKIDQIFTSFSQEDNSTTRNFGGTGLGLTISKSLCLLMNGTIKVRSKKGLGSTFIVELPLVMRQAPTPKTNTTNEHDTRNLDDKNNLDKHNNSDTLTTEQAPTKVVEIPENWPSSTKILLVEDNRINQVVVKKVLKLFNLSCEVANNGQEALDMMYEIKDTPYTLVLMDCQMPVLDGYQTTAKIRQGVAGNNYTGIPIIAMTANAMAGDREKCLQAGMDDYVTKPLDQKIVLATLKKWLIKD